MASNLYASLPLTNKYTIRVLQTDGISADGILNGTLRTIEVNNDAKFDALSYVHDLSTPKRKVKCGGYEIDISYNCYAALKKLQLVRPLNIWVDAVCMQKSEMQHHLAIMSDIFSVAQHVFLWFGNGNEVTDKAMALLATGGLKHFFYKSGGYQEVEKPLKSFWRLYRYPWVLCKRSAKTKQPELHFRTEEKTHVVLISSLTQLLQSVWNTRLWTFSEAILAINPIIVCGVQQVEWMDFAMTVIYLHHTNICKGTPLQDKLESWVGLIHSKEYFARQIGAHIHTKQYLREISRYNALTRYIELLRELAKRRRRMTVCKYWMFWLFCIAGFNMCFTRIRKYVAWWPLIIFGIWIMLGGDNNFSLGIKSDRTPLLDSTILDQFQQAVRQRKVTDQKDMYLAIRPVLSVLAQKDAPLVDSTKDAYRELTKSLFGICGAVSLIEDAARTRLAGPTWVPDYSTTDKLGVLNMSAKIAGLNATAMAEPPAGGVLNKPKVGPDSITVTGVHLHTITDIYSIQPTRKEYDISEHETHLGNYRTIHAMVRASNMEAGRGNDPGHKEFKKMKKLLSPELLAFLDNLWWDKDVKVKAEHLVAYIQHFSMTADVNAIFTDPTIAVDTSFWPPWTQTTSNMWRVHMTLCQLMIKHNCVFFRGQIKNGYGTLWPKISRICHGICLRNAGNGDEVVLIEGVKLPLIMKPKITDYYVVTNAHVFGMMKGQAWEYSESQDDAPTLYFQNRQHEIRII